MKRKITRNWTKPTQISKHLYCPVCADVYRDPLRLFCGHTFCKQCLDQWKAASKSCPECRQEFDDQLIAKDLLANKIIDDLEVSCINKCCDWNDRLELLEKHVKTCQFEKEIPAWVLGLRTNECIELDDAEEEKIYGTSNDALYEKLNEEMPRGSLTMRLLKKDNKNLKTIKSLLTNDEEEQEAAKNKKKAVKSQSLHDFDSLFTIEVSDEEEKHQDDDIIIESATTNNDVMLIGKRSTSSINVIDESISTKDSRKSSTRRSKSNMTSATKNIKLDSIVEEEIHLNDDELSKANIGDHNYEGSNASGSVNKDNSDLGDLSTNNSVEGKMDDIPTEDIKAEGRGRRKGLRGKNLKKMKTTAI